MANCSKVDLQHEFEFQARWQNRFPGCSLNKLNDYQRLDYLMTGSDRTGIAFVEYKYRNYSIDRFPTVYLNLNKWLAMGQIASQTGLRVLFICSFGQSGDYCYRWRESDKYPIGYCPESQEAVVLIPKEKFSNVPYE